MFKMLRLRRSKSGRVQMAPQQNSVTSSYMGMVNSSAFAID